jgi:hypothetical protein
MGSVVRFRRQLRAAAFKRLFDLLVGQRGRRRRRARDAGERHEDANHQHLQ